MSVNNFKQIRDLLEFRNNDDFYFLQILQRKKDHKEGQKVNGTNNNSRLVKAYFIKSVEHFDFVEDEVIKLCELFNARAGINLNRRSFKKMALQHLKKCTDQILNEDYTKAHRAYNTVSGAFMSESDKKWIIDLDGEIESHDDFIELISGYIAHLMPNIGESKVICKIPSKNGAHLITSSFNLGEFKKALPEIEVHKNNPTNLYIP
jgi:hypothetical protein